EGFNTDAEGFLRHLSGVLGFDPRGKTISMIGAGGAARAVSVYLAKNRPAVLNIYDLDKARLSTLVAYLSNNFRDMGIRQANSIAELDIKKCDLLINATPVGMKLSDPCLVNASMIHKDLLVYDLIYNPKETKLLKLARENGARTSNGLGMLLYQGMASFEIWTAQKAPQEAMQKALEGALSRAGFNKEHAG
ncbi:MAG: shikimate dehydrogenase, partial [Candidatus Omnitrophica bacterium]|nr:shikimate dehydrogenase [Candidatus Omnitrophota bacterium]